MLVIYWVLLQLSQLSISRLPKGLHKGLSLLEAMQEWRHGIALLICLPSHLDCEHILRAGPSLIQVISLAPHISP